MTKEDRFLKGVHRCKEATAFPVEISVGFLQNAGTGTIVKS